MNQFLGYMALVFILLLGLLCPLRIWCRKTKGYTYLSRLHKWIAFATLIISFIHGILSGNKTGMISGKMSWMLLLVMCMTCMLTRKMRNHKRIHHILMTIFLFVCISHMIWLW